MATLHVILRNILRKLRVSASDQAGTYHDAVFKNYIFEEFIKNMSRVFRVDNHDKTDTIVNVGKYEEVIGRPRENLETNHLDWLEAERPEDRARVEAAFPRELTGNFDQTYRVAHPDGSIKWLRDRAFLIPNR